MQQNSIQPVDARTLRKSVTEAIRQVILTGQLLPGDQVNQVQIAEQLGVSRGPVREALSQLEEEGLIRSVPYKGTYVTDITREYIVELYSMRRVLETFAVRRNIEHATPAEQAELRAVVELMRAAAAADDTAQLGALDIQFHYLICRNAHHALLLQIWKSIEMGVRRCLTLRHRIYQDPNEIVGTHPDIVEAIAAGRSDLASLLLDIHIQDAGEQLLRAWQPLSPPDPALAPVALAAPVQDLPLE